MLNRIIVLLDGSSFAEDALAVALSLADESTHIDLVTAEEGAPPFAVPDYETYIREGAERYLADLRTKLPPTVTSHAHVLFGSPRREILSFLEQSEADVVVMTTHGRGPFTRAWLGSMADFLIKTSPRPLLLVRPEKGSTPDYQALPPLRRVLIPLDGSSLSEVAATQAHDIFGTDLEVTLLRIVTYPSHFTSPYLPDIIIANKAFAASAKTKASAYLERVRESLGIQGKDVQTVVILSDHPAREISKYAEDKGFDVIALATHGRGGLTRLALGSVADKIVRTATVPVLALRPQDSAENQD